MRVRTGLAAAATAAAVTVAGGTAPAFAADSGPVPAGVDCPASDGARVTNTPATYPKTVALTFDDGPDPTWTPQVLAVLRRHHVHGTFFVIGRKADADQGVLAEVVADGNVIGNHTWSHPTAGSGFTELTETEVADELDRTEGLLQQASDQPVCFFRAPQGKDTAPALKQAAHVRGLTVTNMYSAHDYAQPDQLDPAWVELITARLVGQGRHPILLLHDGGSFRGNTVEALDRIITWYAERGYVFTDPAGRPFGDDPAADDPPTGYALPPTADQEQVRAARLAEQQEGTAPDTPDPEVGGSASGATVHSQRVRRPRAPLGTRPGLGAFAPV
jgi:peptidoglycan-N-acetylglucosamine deacetylase